MVYNFAFAYGLSADKGPCAVWQILKAETLLLPVFFIYEYGFIHILRREVFYLDTCAWFIGGKVYEWKIYQRVYHESYGGYADNGKGDVFSLALWLSESSDRHCVGYKKDNQQDVLYECLPVSQVDGLSEASAVHFRVKYDQDKCQQGKECLQADGGECYGASPHSSNQTRSEQSLRKGECDSSSGRSEIKKSDVKEFEVFLHHQRCTYRIHEFYKTGKEEYESYGHSAESLQSQEDVSHLLPMFESTTSRIFMKISSGPSIFPSASEQSMRMNLGSTSHCL